MQLMTPNGIVDVTAIQKRAAEQLKGGVITDDIKMAVGLLATVSEELEAHAARVNELLQTTTY